MLETKTKARSSHCLYYHMLLLTGLRRSELLALKWRGLNLDLARIYVVHSLHRLDDGNIIIKEPKTLSSRRPVDLPPSLVLLLRQHRVDQEVQQVMFGQNLDENGFVFSHADGSSLNPSTVTPTFSKVAARADLPYLRLHDLRHIHATMLLKAGIHPKVVQERLRHSSIATTLNIYSHTVPVCGRQQQNVLTPYFLRRRKVKMSAEGEKVKCRPCRSRICDTLIKN